jgi:hypothetical protein
MRVNPDGDFDGNKRDEHYYTEKCHEETWGVEIEPRDFLCATDDEWDQSHDHSNAIHPRSCIKLPLGAC